MVSNIITNKRRNPDTVPGRAKWRELLRGVCNKGEKCTVHKILNLRSKYGATPSIFQGMQEKNNISFEV